MTFKPHNVACPESHLSDFRELECCLGKSMDDRVLRAVNMQKDGVNYSFINFGATDELLAKVDYGKVNGIPRPVHDTESLIDLIAAQRALDRVVIYSGVETVGPDIILAVIDVPAVEAIGLMGLTGIPVEE